MRTLAILLLGLLSLSAFAHTEPLTYNRIAFTEEASADVDNDLLVAVMYVEREGPRAEVLAGEVNRAVARAVDRAKQVPGVSVQTQSYRTTAVYHKSSISGWRVNQSIRLESRDSQRLGDLIGELQDSLNVQSISYQVSEEQQRIHVERLVEQALQRFQQRAKDIAATLGKSTYRIVHVSVNSGTGSPVPMRADMMMRMEADARVAAPRIEAGTQRLQVTVSAEIELAD